MSGNGPWDSNNNDGNGNEGAKKPKPANPWDPANAGDGKVSSLEELLRKRQAGGGGGNGPFANMPSFPNGKPIWIWAGILLTFLWLIWTSFHQLQNNETGVVTTFGKYTRSVGPGISLVLPYPIQNLEKVDTGRSRSTTIGAPGSNTENLILTSDKNVIDMAYNVRWKVVEPQKFLFQLSDPEQTLSEVAESAMRASVANFQLTQAIGPGRGAIQADVKDRMNRMLGRRLYDSGVVVQSIDIKESEAPKQVSEAFNRVQAATQEAESNKNEARKYASQIVERARGETSEFNEIYTQYAQAPEVTKRRIYYETMEQVLAQNDKTIVESGNVTPYLPLPEMQKRAKAAPATVAPAEKAK